MAVTQYIGARYVPLFADPAEWSANNQYEPLTIVTYQGASYTSKQAVPTGIDITNADYWALTGNYNAQVEQYRQEVRQFDGRITENAEAIDSEADTRAQADTALGTRITNEANARESADTALGTRITNEANARESADTALGTRITNEANARESADTQLQNRIAELENADTYFAVIGDSFSNESTEWPNMLASATGMRLINKASNGAGFTTGTKTFIQQFNELVANANWTKVKYLIIYGGINDFNDANASVSDMQIAFNALRNAINAQAHKPTVILAFGNMGYAKQARYGSFGNWYFKCLNVATQYFPGVVQNVPYWLWYGANFQSDNLHPNAAGQARILNYMLNILNGSYDGVHFIKTFDNINTENATGGLSVRFDNGVITVDFMLQILNLAHNTYIEICNAGDCTWTFGSIGGRESAKANQLCRFPDLISTTESGGTITGIENREAYFNKASGVVYYRLRGSNITTEAFSFNATYTCGA